MTISASSEKETMSSSMEISIKGKWVRVPSLTLGNQTIVIRGKWLKVASIHDQEWLATEIEDPEICIKALRNHTSNRLRADIFTFAQKIPGSPPKYKYPMEWDSIAAVHLTSFKEWWEGLPQEGRKNVRRSQRRGVTIAVKEFDDHLVEGIAGVNNDSPLRQGTINVHYGKSIDQVKRDHCSFVDRSDFICAYFGDELIGYLKLVYRGELASILNLASKASHYDKRPNNALVTKAMELCEAKGVSYVTYGMFNYGNKRESPLREFKIRNGFVEVLTPRYYVPITLWGRICMKANLHRGPLGFLPTKVIMFAVSARKTWYTTRSYFSRCSSMPEQPNRNRQMERSTPPAGSSGE